MKFQNLSLHLKQIAATLAVGFVLVGCSKENENLSVSSSSQINSTSTISSTPSSTASSNLEQENQEGADMGGDYCCQARVLRTRR